MIQNRSDSINLVILSMLFMIIINSSHCVNYIELPEMPPDHLLQQTNNLNVQNNHYYNIMAIFREDAIYQQYDKYIFEGYLFYLLDNLMKNNEYNNDKFIQNCMSNLEQGSTSNQNIDDDIFENHGRKLLLGSTSNINNEDDTSYRKIFEHIHKEYFWNTRRLREIHLLSYVKYENAFNGYKNRHTNEILIYGCFKKFLPNIYDTCKTYVNSMATIILSMYKNPCRGDKYPEWFNLLKYSIPLKEEIYDTYKFRQIFYNRLPVHKDDMITVYGDSVDFLDNFNGISIPENKQVNVDLKVLLCAMYLKAQECYSVG